MVVSSATDDMMLSSELEMGASPDLITIIKGLGRHAVAISGSEGILKECDIRHWGLYFESDALVQEKKIDVIWHLQSKDTNI